MIIVRCTILQWDVTGAGWMMRCTRDSRIVVIATDAKYYTFRGDVTIIAGALACYAAALLRPRDLVVRRTMISSSLSELSALEGLIDSCCQLTL